MNEALYGAQANTATTTTTAASVAPAAATTPAIDNKSTASTSTTSSTSNFDASSLVSKIGIGSQGQNAQANNGACWIGSDGPNVNTVKNAASGQIVLVVWGPLGSWVNANAPLITYGLNPGGSVQISCSTGYSGGMSAIYSGTTLSPYGQVDNTWVEFTYGQYGTVDVSREVNMNGNSVSVVGATCTTDMNNCVFVCNSGTTCGAANSYTLKNCGPSNGGQSDAAAQNGGCFMGSNAMVTTTWS